LKEKTREKKKKNGLQDAMNKRPSPAEEGRGVRGKRKRNEKEKEKKERA